MLQDKWVLTAANRPGSTWRGAAAAWMYRALAYDRFKTDPTFDTAALESGWCVVVLQRPKICMHDDAAAYFHPALPKEPQSGHASSNQMKIVIAYSVLSMGHHVIMLFGENKPACILAVESQGIDLEAAGTIFGKCSVP